MPISKIADFYKKIDCNSLILTDPIENKDSKEYQNTQKTETQKDIKLIKSWLNE